MDQDSATQLDGADSGYESPYIKELQRNIRSVNKKLSAMQKVDSIIAANPETSLDDLVASRKINSDQKAQAQKKPALQASLAQFEEQISQYRKFDEEYQQRASSEKAQLKAAHAKELEDLQKSLKEEGVAESQQLLRQRLLTLSRFLRAAAARRQEDDETSDETKAFEGVLLLLYGGDNVAVDAAEKLICDAEDGVLSTEGTLLTVTYQQINRIALDYAPPTEGESVEVAAPTGETAGDEQSFEPQSTTAHDAEVESDPTIAHASFTELEDLAQEASAPLSQVQDEVVSAPAAATIGDEAANASATEQWDSKPSADGLEDSWVSVPRNQSEMETETAATPPAEGATITTLETVSQDATTMGDTSQNWADDIPASAALSQPSDAASTPAINDGFHEVVHGRGGKGRGGKPQEQRGGGGRGRGQRGGRGDGSRSRGPRGDRGRGRAA